MPDKKISELSPATNIDGTELIEIVQSGENLRLNLSQLAKNNLISSTSTSVTVLATHQGAIIETDNASANSVFVPDDGTLALPIGALVGIRQVGVGQTTIVGSGSTVLQKKATRTLAIAERFGEVVLQKRAANTWLVTGELEIL